MAGLYALSRIEPDRSLAVEYKTQTRVYSIVTERLEALETQLTAVAKRCARKSLPVPTWALGGSKVIEGCHRTELTLVNAVPSYGNWTLIAQLTREGDANIVCGIGGAEVPREYQTSAMDCDHCGMKRRRNETYVCRHVDGRVLQVGSTCLADFVGVTSAANAAQWASIEFEIGALCDSDEYGGGGYKTPDALEHYLSFVAMDIRVHGWVSKAMAETNGVQATADAAYTAMCGASRKPDVELPSEADTAVSLDTIAWIEASAEPSDYMHNLRTIAASGRITARTYRFAASAIASHTKAKERAIEASITRASEHVGTIGTRLRDLQLTVKFVTGYETQFGWCNVVSLIDTSGNVYVWRTSSAKAPRNAEVGNSVRVTGTVKRHGNYKGTKQTELARCIVD